MELWAKAMPAVQFLCICVESQRVALAFGRMFQFEKVVNCFIPSRTYMPVGFGQLGCSGFIVVDKKGNFVSRRTRAFLDYGDVAFDHVEELLAEQLRVEAAAAPAATASPVASSVPDAHRSYSFSPGSTACIDEKETLGGSLVTIVRFDPASGCFVVRMQGTSSTDQSFLFRPCSLRPPDATPTAVADGPTCVVAAPASKVAHYNSFGPPPSVGVASMDQEHEACTEALAALLKTPTTVSLQKVLDSLMEHFHHEEALMKEHGFGGSSSTDGASSTFSAFASHAKDHQRILTICRIELERASSCEPAAACETGS
jgi:hypothetical protein